MRRADFKNKIMIQIDEQKLRQLFKNRSNCYADAEDVVQAMDEDCFIETVNEALRLFAVVGRSEQLSCETCIFNTHSWSEDYPCATCCGFDKHQAT